MKRSKKLMWAEIMPALQQKVQKKFSRRILSCILAVALMLGGIPVFSFTTVNAAGADDLTLSADTAVSALNEEGTDLVSDEGVLDLRGTGIVIIPDASSEANSEYGGNTSVLAC